MIGDDILKKEWFLLERLHHYPPITLVPCCIAMTTDFALLGLVNIPHAIHEYAAGTTLMHYPADEWHTAAKQTFEIMRQDPTIMDRLHEESDTVLVPRIREISWNIINKDLDSCSNDDLLSLYQALYPLKTRLQLIRCIGWLMETSGGYLSGYLIGYLRDAIKKYHLAEDPVLIFSALTNPTKPSLVNKEHMALLQLAKQVQDGSIKATVDAPEVIAHAEQWAFLPFGCEGPAWTPEDIVSHINEILHAGVSIDITKQIEDHQGQFEEKKKKQSEIYERIPIDEHHRHLMQVAQDIVYQKAWSKEHQYLSWYALDFLLRAIAKRLYMTIQQVRYLLPRELPEALRQGGWNVNELNQRYEYSLLCFGDGESYIVSGQEAKTLRISMNVQKEATIDVSNVKEFFGQSAVPGQARGTVRIINTIAEMAKMEKGDILVSEMTIPEIVAAMKKAGAIITDMGGITCHAAIVSRELGIPCVIGTKIATKVLKDGDLVEVDANQGIVRKI